MDPIKIAINGRFLTQAVTGVQRYALETVRAMDKILGETPGKYDVRVLVPRKGVKQALGLNRGRLVPAGRLTGHLWEQLELPVHAQGDILINLCNPAPLFRKRQICLMHDVIVFGAPASVSFLFRNWHQTIFRAVSKNAHAIVTDSAFSKSEIIKYLGTAAEKISVIHAGCDHIARIVPDYSVIEENALAARPFVLAVSSLNPNKNFDAVVKACERLGEFDFDVVIAGGINPRVFSQGRADFPRNVKYLGYVSDARLKALYSKAACFIFPSFYEGFGLPPLEAMASGAPVIASNASSLPEVCGEAACYMDPNSVDSLVSAIKTVMGDDGLRKAMVQKGLERSRLFTWENTARRLLALCDGLGSRR